MGSINYEDITLNKFRFKDIPNVYNFINTNEDITLKAGYKPYKTIFQTFVSWLETKVNSERKIYTVYNSKDEFIGTISLTKHFVVYMLGIQVRPEFWGKGFSDKMTHAILTMYIDKHIFAKIHKDNEYSRKWAKRNRAVDVTEDENYTYVIF